MAGKITDYTNMSGAATIDRTADLLEIVDLSGDVSYKATPNFILGITGAPVGLTDVQALTNKTLGNTNTITLKASLFTLQDQTDTTKQAVFSLAGITTGTTRTYTLPNASVTLADTSSAQTLTNKTLTSPTITTPTINNPTLNTDAISEFTGSNGVTVAGVNIKSGALNTNNSVVTANVTDGAITPAKLQSGTGAGWAWSTWVPSLTNMTLGNGTLVAKYIQSGKTVHLIFNLTLGSTSAVATNPTFSLPVTATAAAVGNAVGTASFGDAGVQGYAGLVQVISTTTANLQVYNTAGTYAATTTVTAAIPFAFAAADGLGGALTYEAA